MTNNKTFNDDRPDKGLFEYGTPLDDIDISLSNRKIEKISIPGGTLYVAGNPENKNTVVILPGGSGKVFTMLDSTDGFNGPIFPANLVDSIGKDINVVFLSLPHGLPWVWASMDIKLKKIPQPIDSIKKIVNGIGDSDSNLYRLLKSFITLNTAISTASQLFPDSKIWLSGHCTGCRMIAKFLDSIEDPHLLHGLVFMNPRRKNHGDYFEREIGVPLLIIQHVDDPAPNSSTEIASNIAKSHDATYYEIEGGIDYGYHSFSLGLHGFRGREDRVAEIIKQFVESR